MPALLLEISTPDHSSTMWVQKHRSRPVTVDGELYEITYGERTVDLGFTLTLNRFHIGHYPGTSQPRSFESHVTITDPNTGREISQVISMNHPTDYAGYSLFQSSYRVGGGQRISYLSVSRDPGLPIVFAGYITTLIGMVVVLATRMLGRRRTLQEAAAPARQVATALSSPGHGSPRTGADSESPWTDKDPGSRRAARAGRPTAVRSSGSHGDRRAIR
jgi:cytochrome c biogenesis protein ResB